MPASKKIPKEAIRSALRETGGAVAAAAHKLHISPRTLQRRLRENPDLRPHESDVVWDRAFERTCDIIDAADGSTFSPNVGHWSHRYRYVNWSESSVEVEPIQLDPREVYELWQKMWNTEQKFLAKPSAQQRKFYKSKNPR